MYTYLRGANARMAMVPNLNNTHPGKHCARGASAHSEIHVALVSCVCVCGFVRVFVCGILLVCVCVWVCGHVRHPSDTPSLLVYATSNCLYTFKPLILVKSLGK